MENEWIEKKTKKERVLYFISVCSHSSSMLQSKREREREREREMALLNVVLSSLHSMLSVTLLVSSLFPSSVELLLLLLLLQRLLLLTTNKTTTKMKKETERCFELWCWLRCNTAAATTAAVLWTWTRLKFLS